MRGLTCILLLGVGVAVSFGQIPTGYMRGSYDPWGFCANPVLKLANSVDDSEYRQKHKTSMDWLLKQYRATEKIEYGHAFLWLAYKYDEKQAIRECLDKLYDRATLNRMAVEYKVDRLSSKEWIFGQACIAYLYLAGEHVTKIKDLRTNSIAQSLREFSKKRWVATTPEEAVIQLIAMSQMEERNFIHSALDYYLERWPDSQFLLVVGAKLYLQGTNIDPPKPEKAKRCMNALAGENDPGIMYYLGAYHLMMNDKQKAQKYLSGFLASDVRNKTMRAAAEERLRRARQ